MGLSPTSVDDLFVGTMQPHQQRSGASSIPSLFNCTLEELTHGLAAGDFTSEQLVRAYKARYDEVDDTFHAVIQWDTEAEITAHALDEERLLSGPRR